MKENISQLFFYKVHIFEKEELVPLYFIQGRISNYFVDIIIYLNSY